MSKFYTIISAEGRNYTFNAESEEAALISFKSASPNTEPKVVYGANAINAPFKELLNKKFTAVEQLENSILFTTDFGHYLLQHDQDCCETVWIESIVGDLSDLVGSPILLAEESVSVMQDASESGTYTFYKLATIKGYVDIRWIGESNGYYSESVDMVFIPKLLPV